MQENYYDAHRYGNSYFIYVEGLQSIFNNVSYNDITSKKIFIPERNGVYVHYKKCTQMYKQI